MRLDQPRIQPLADEDWDPELRKRFEGSSPFNIFRVLANHPALARRWIVFANHVLSKSSLPPRERELAILRVGWKCQSGYEWGQHVEIGKRDGLSEEDIARIPNGPEDPDWSEFDRALLRATDEILDDSFVSDATWQQLETRYDTQQMMDLVFAVGQYKLVSSALNSFGVQLDPGLEGLPSK